MAELDRILDRFDLKTLETAMARRRKRERQRVVLLQQRRKLEAQLAKLSNQIGTNGGRSNAPIERRPNARRLNDITLAEALEKALGSKRRTMHYKDLTDAVVKRGLYRTKSKNLLSTVAVTLMRDQRFKKVKPGIFALR